MVDDKENREVNTVSEFLRNSCQLCPSNRVSFANYFRGVSYPITRPNGVNCKLLPVSTGSIAEFYIKPMLSCIGDIDVMYHYSNDLAIPQWHPPPTQLPADFENCVKVYEIINSPIPGYVYLYLTYIISRNMPNDEYVIAECVSSRNAVLNNELHLFGEREIEIHGPAYMFSSYSLTEQSLPNIFGQPGLIDAVPCIHCFVWPPQAADWPKRPKKCGWPDLATVSCVVSKGCDLVGVSHRLCREDEWMSKHQWRLSFSRAEVVLLNSWMPEQQIVYHMLRVYAKTELLIRNTLNCGTYMLCNYHIKTLMLWDCELNQQHWRNDGFTLIRKSLRLLQFLEEWLTKMHGQHYFVNSVHFHDYFDTSCIDTIAAVVRSSTAESLAKWFGDNYIRKCAKLCPDTVSFLCSDLVTSEIPTDTLGVIMQFRDHVCSQTFVNHWFYSFVLFFFLVPMLNRLKTTASECPSTVQDQVLFPTTLRLPQLDKHALQAIYYMIMVSNYSHRFKYKTLMWDIITPVICAQCTSADERYRLQCFSVESSALHSVSYFQKATVLMELVANKQRSTCRLVLIELSKLHLWRALQCDNSESDSVRCLALMYLSVLYYTTGKYQMAIYHCTLKMDLQGHAQCCMCSSHVVEGKLLPKIDDNIDCVLGLVVFYRYTLAAIFKRLQTKQVGIFTLELFAHYFTIKHLLFARCHCLPKFQEKKQYKCYLHEEIKSCFSIILTSKHLYISDLMLCKLSSNSCQQCHRGRSNTATWNSTADICRKQMANLITELSLEQLLTHHRLMLSSNMESMNASNRSDFLALYLYRCRLIEQCRQLCHKRVRVLINADRCDIPHMSIIYHEFLELMDDDVVSAIGLTFLLHKTCHLSWIRRHVTVTELTLSLYLLVKCQLGFRQMPSDRHVHLGTLAVMLDWIASAMKTIPASEFVDHLILKLAERQSIIHITRKLMGDNTSRYAGTFKLCIAFDVTNGFQLALTHAKDCNKTFWVSNGARSFILAMSASGMEFGHLRNKESAHVLNESSTAQIQLQLPILLAAGFLQRSGNSQ